MQPDLVLAWRTGNPPADVRRLGRLGLNVLVTETTRLAEIAPLVREIGRAAGTSATAETAAAAFEQQLAALREAYANRRPVRVFYQIWHQPLLTVNGAHLISDVVALCGGRNVFSDAPVLTPAVSMEAVLAARPEVVLGGSSSAGPDALAAQWRAVAASALRHTPVAYVPPDLIQRQTPRVVEGARIVCEHLARVREGKGTR